MPLSFASKSHGAVAFGFFNIESDMLLLDNLFFFADVFCSAAARLLEAPPGPAEHRGEGWRIAGFESIGNLHGAIAGTDLSGFIGATYAAWPFPAAPEDFHQNPEGFRTRERVRKMIAGFGEPDQVLFRRDAAGALFGISEFEFDRRGFLELAAYVERGGYPRWKGGKRPEYVKILGDPGKKPGETVS